MYKIHPFVAGAAALLCFAGSAHAANPVLKIDPCRVTAQVSPTLYGLMTEEINHSYDGGLYAELIRNRIFKDDPAGPAGWALVQENGGSGTMGLDKTQPVNDALTVCLKLTVAAGSGRTGIANGGYWGIAVRPKTAYRLSFYARAEGSAGPLAISLESNDGAKVFAHAEAPKLSAGWQNYTVSLTTGDDAPVSSENRLVIATKGPGTFWFNLVSLFPPTFNDRPNGNRIDIMHALDEMHPAFLRLPGGNYLEGDTVETRFDWKKTLGPLAQRPGHEGCWRYRSSDGLGLLEFLEWCEDLRLQPVLGIYAGYSLRQHHIDPGPALAPFVQDALDEIEYITGGPETKWGSQRAAGGHPTPFPLTYVEVGNEDAFDKSHSYDGRFTQFYDAIKAKYPRLQLIATMKVSTRTPDLYDEHFYRTADGMEKDTHHYDKRSRTGPKVFVGEWATREGSPTPNMSSALADAAWMTGMERNSDLVVMSSYAPLLVNVSPKAGQWSTNLIGYDALTCYGSPSYYAQQMFSRHRGDQVVAASLEGGEPVNSAGAAPIPSFFYVVTKDSRQTLYVKAVNTGGAPQPVDIQIAASEPPAAEGSALVLSAGSPADTNSITEPAKIVPVASRVSGVSPAFTYTFAPYSITILELPLRVK